MKKIIALTITIISLAVIMPAVCHSGSLPAEEKGNAIKGVYEKNDKDTMTIQDKNKEDGPEDKTKDMGPEEPEYDMDLEIDFKDERC